MTIILAIPAKDGLVLASDGQITSGDIRTTGKKIKKLNDKCLWSASGESALIQRVEEAMSGVPNKQAPLKELRDKLASTILQCSGTFYKLVSRPISGDFVFVEHVDSPRILHITYDGTPEWIDRCFASGMGAKFGYPLLLKYQSLIPNEVDVERASLLAFKIIEETIEVGAYGLGPPIDIWEITAQGIENLDDKKISGLEDTSSLLRKAEIKLFLEQRG